MKITINKLYRLNSDTVCQFDDTVTVNCEYVYNNDTEVNYSSSEYSNASSHDVPDIPRLAVHLAGGPGEVPRQDIQELRHHAAAGGRGDRGLCGARARLHAREGRLPRGLPRGDAERVPVLHGGAETSSIPLLQPHHEGLAAEVPRAEKEVRPRR